MNCRARILSYEGSADGLRFGQLVLGGGVSRRFLFDRLHDSVQLWQGCREADIGMMTVDEAPAHHVEALTMLRAHSAGQGEPAVPHA